MRGTIGRSERVAFPHMAILHGEKTWRKVNYILEAFSWKASTSWWWTPLSLFWRMWIEHQMHSRYIISNNISANNAFSSPSLAHVLSFYLAVPYVLFDPPWTSWYLFSRVFFSRQAQAQPTRYLSSGSRFRPHCGGEIQQLLKPLPTVQMPIICWLWRGLILFKPNLPFWLRRQLCSGSFISR